MINPEEVWNKLFPLRIGDRVSFYAFSKGNRWVTHRGIITHILEEREWERHYRIEIISSEYPYQRDLHEEPPRPSYY